MPAALAGLPTGGDPLRRLDGLLPRLRNASRAPVLSQLAGGCARRASATACVFRIWRDRHARLLAAPSVQRIGSPSSFGGTSDWFLVASGRSSVSPARTARAYDIGWLSVQPGSDRHRRECGPDTSRTKPGRHQWRQATAPGTEFRTDEDVPDICGADGMDRLTALHDHSQAPRLWLRRGPEVRLQAVGVLPSIDRHMTQLAAICAAKSGSAKACAHASIRSRQARTL